MNHYTDFLILGSVALMGVALSAILLLVVIGIRRSDRCKRLTGRSGSVSEALARQLLVGSRGYNSPRDAGDDQ